MEYDAIPHYLTMASALKAFNINNNADSNKEKEKDTLPTLQVNPINPIDPINTHLHSVSSGNLAQKYHSKASKLYSNLTKDLI